MKKTNKPYDKIKTQKEYRKILLIATISAFIITGGMALGTDLDLTFNSAYAEVNFPEKPEAPKKLTAREYIFQEAEKAGLDISKVDCLIDHESDYKNTWNVNKNGSVDFGRWMINSVHIGNSITLECAVNLECSTAWSIERLKKGKWDMWYGYKNNCK
jgi:hypothetical protein